MPRCRIGGPPNRSIVAAARALSTAEATPAMVGANSIYIYDLNIT